MTDRAKELCFIAFYVLIIFVSTKYASGAELDPELMTKYSRLKHVTGCEFKINSGWRSKKHNKRVGGVKGSYHLVGKAIDITPKRLCKLSYFDISLIAIKLGFKGVITYKSHIHLDLGNRRYYKIRSRR